MNDEWGSVIFIDKPNTPVFGDLNRAASTGLINLAYGRYHDAFLNVPLSETALPMIDPAVASPDTPVLWCLDREQTCPYWNHNGLDDRLDKVLQANKDQPIYDSIRQVPPLNRMDLPQAHGGPVDPMWYPWTTTPAPGIKSPLLAAASSETTTTAAAAAAATDPALNPDPNFATNCTCQYEVDDGQLAMTLTFSAGAASLLTGLLMCANSGQNDAREESIWGTRRGSSSTDESFEQMLAE